MKLTFYVCTLIAVFSFADAQANHCEEEAINAKNAIYSTTTTDPQILETAQALLEKGLEICAFEEQVLLEASEIETTETDVVSMGQSMLINAEQLVGQP